MKTNKSYLFNLFKKLVQYYKNNIYVVVLFLLLTYIFIYLRTLPYINIIEHFYYYVGGLYFVILLVIYKKEFTPKRVFILAEVFLLISLFASFFNVSYISEVIGFLVLLILIVMVLYVVIKERKVFKKAITND